MKKLVNEGAGGPKGFKEKIKKRGGVPSGGPQMGLSQKTKG